jgi:hypothetical protein
VEVGDGLSAMRALIDHRAESRLIDSLIPRDFSDSKQQMSEDFLILGGGLADPGNGFARNNQDMGGSLWGNIPEGATDRITVNDVRWDFTIIDLFKKRFHGERRLAIKTGIASSGNK